MEYNARVAARYRRLHNCALLLKERVQELLGDKLAREVELSDTHEVSAAQLSALLNLNLNFNAPCPPAANALISTHH